MTFPCKEELMYLQQLENRQYRIYDDAADSGIRFDDVDINKARAAIRELMSVHGYETTKSETDKAVKIYIPVERDDGRVYGYTLNAGACKDRKGGFIWLMSQYGPIGNINVDLSKRSGLINK